ncbi:Hsp20/alpha crystallin family protein [Candidatus Bathyarchaeota archaeon]|nr:Hsp20/alpha crystallin family protein [Candidatus Bathyarchaeota archaeon]
MNDPWWRRRKKKGPWFNDIYDELERLGDLIDETMQKAFDDSSENSPIKHNRVKGFSINFGPDGKPRIDEIDHRQPWQEEDEISDDQEPLVDFIEDGETLIILVALPGVEKEAIDLRVTENCLTISVDGADFEWYDELKFPARVNPKSACASYKNGVLEVKLSKSKKVAKGSKILRKSEV